MHLLPGDPIPGRRDGTQTSGRSVNDLFLTLLHCVGLHDIESFAEIDTLPIATADHCFGCTAGAGSSCSGAVL